MYTYINVNRLELFKQSVGHNYINIYFGTNGAYRLPTYLPFFCFSHETWWRCFLIAHTQPYMVYFIINNSIITMHITLVSIKVR